ncbi:hypothetical protein [Verrucomicrobium spinosum]|uniref:hypothetical protein n=1 Tax=Verrucomicrobium spinosum TaxID=2736 RepID=UPI00155D93DC|nr:hypothetical protein [Verrucomicrobium spinosum]
MHTGLPEGWSKENLSRLKPSKFSLITRRRGTMAAKEMLPNIIRTRVGLEFGALYQIDDQDYDVYTNLVGINRRAMRPSGFNALEVLSACHFAHCAKPMIYNPEDGSRSRLTEEDCAWFVLFVLTEHGYRADVGTTFMAEKGTAAIRAALAEGLARVTDGKVQVATSGILGGPMLEGLAFKGAPRGNFRFKSHIESSFALVRTIMSHLKGATGTRLTAPEENYALLKYNDKLLKWAEKLPPQRAALLVKEVMTWQEFGQVNHTLMEMMNQRDWHDLEAGRSAGLWPMRCAWISGEMSG